MINIKIYIRNNIKNSKEGILWVQFYVNREKINFSTKVRCREKDFNKKTSRVKSSDPYAYDKNLVIERILSKCNRQIKMLYTNQ
jgi:hypothetical protein